MNLCYEYLECIGYDALFYAELVASEALRKELVPNHCTSTIISNGQLAADMSTARPIGAVDDTDVLKLPIVRQLDLRPGRKAPAVVDDTLTPTQRYEKSKQSAMVAYRRGSIAPIQCDSCQRGLGPYKQCIIIPNWMKGSCANCRHSDKASLCSFRSKFKMEHNQSGE
jgi:hypothetical protein